MILARLTQFLKARPAIAVAALLLLIFLLGIAGALRPRRPVAKATVHPVNPSPPVTSIVREAPPVSTVAPRANNAGTHRSQLPLIPLQIRVALPPDSAPPPLGHYAPAGRLIRCQLFNTIDSANIDTPLIALVTDPLWHEGQNILPAGTELHGRAQLDRMRERIVASGAWTIVWQTGEELVVDGIALDRDEQPGSHVWGITDGSAGLKGRMIRSDSLAEIKLFVATFVSGTASGLQESRDSVFGPQIARTTRNAALSGAGQVMNTYAQQILETIRRDGLFVRVPAGKQMYLYATQTIDRSQARRGGSRVISRVSPVHDKPSSPRSQP